MNPNDPNDVYVAGDGTDETFGGEVGTVSEWDGDWDQVTGITDTPTRTAAT